MVRGFRKVRQRHSLSLPGGDTQNASVERDAGGADRLLESRIKPVRFGKLEHVLCRVVAENLPGIGIRKFHRLGHDRRQHRLGIERRRDGAADFLKRLQFADRLGEIGGAFRDFLLEAAIGSVQFTRHPVELVGQFLDLIPGMDVDAVAEIAGLQLLGADLQGLDRRDQLARQ